MSSELDSAISDLASTLVTGSTPDKPDATKPVRFLTGTVSGSPTSGRIAVDFPNSVGGNDTQNLRYALTGRTLVSGETVLVMQFPNQRLVLFAISH